MHTGYYANEVRDFGEIPKGDGKLGKQELELGQGLIDELSQTSFARTSTKTNTACVSYLSWKRKPRQVNRSNRLQRRRASPTT